MIMASIRQTTLVASKIRVTPSPTPFILPRGEDIKQNTISFTTIQGKVFLRYKGTFYDIDDAMNNPIKVSVTNEKKLSWVGITDGPEKSDQVAFDEIFSFKRVPNSNDFLFVLRFDSWLAASESAGQTIQLFQYSLAKDPHVISYQPFVAKPENTDFVFPKITSFSTDSKKVAISLFTCWNCQNTSHKILLLNLNSHATKIIGPIGSFLWNSKEMYTYQDKPSRPCDQFSEEGCEELKKLPLKQGSF